MSQGKIEAQYIMFTGTPGTRKSTQALSYPRPQFWLSWDQKMNALRLPMMHWGIDPKEIHYEDYRDWNTARAKLESFITQSTSFSPQPIPYKTIIVDSITSMADGALQQTKDLKRGTTRSSGRDAGKSVGGIIVNELEDYNAEAAALQELISLTKQVHKMHKVNIILIAHLIQAEYKSANSQANMVRTIVTAGKRIAPKIPAYCEESYHFFLKTSFDVSVGGEYAVLTSSTNEDFARSTLPLPREIVLGDDPLYSKYVQPAIEKLNTQITNTQNTQKE